MFDFSLISADFSVVSAITPPVAVNLYVTTHLDDIPLEQTFKEVLPLVVAMLVALLVMIAVPALSLVIPACFGLM